MFTRLTFNFAPTTDVRTETMEGIEYTVVPMAMLTEGVHPGSDGPLLYTANELSKIPAIWNGRPIVVYHPTFNGQAVSAGDPIVFEKQKIGFVMNTHWKDKLFAEAWIDSKKARQVDDRVMHAIDTRTPMEISTGLFCDKKGDAGTWNEETYIGEASNFRPDHLAILPDQKGACSLEDGAGLLVANALDPQSKTATHLRKLVKDQRNGELLDVFPDFAVYRNDTNIHRCSYTTTNQAMCLGDDDETLDIVTEYRTAAGAFVGNASVEQSFNQPPETSEGDSMGMKEMVDGLIANQSTNWTEGDREFLSEQSEEILAKLAPVANEETEEEVSEEESTVEEPARELEQAPVDNSAKQLTMEQFLASAPPELAGPLNSVIANHNAQHATMVAGLVANENCAFSEAELKRKDINELQKLSKMVSPVSNGQQQPALPVPAPLFTGAATPPTGNNASNEDPLVMPSMEF